MNAETEPDYTMEIIYEEDGTYVVHEGGKDISLGFATLKEAEWWLVEHVNWYQPECCCCGSRITRIDDPWTTIQVSRNGAIKAHESCWKEANDRANAHWEAEAK
jgi:hypothetical protein